MSRKNTSSKEKIKKVKKHKIGWWKRHLDTLFREWFRENHTRCDMCGRLGDIQVSHILSKGSHPALRYDPMNIVAHCGRCHRFIWHDDPIVGWKWFTTKYPDRVKYLNEADKIYVKRNDEYFLKVEKAIKDRDFKGLLIYDRLVS